VVRPRIAEGARLWRAFACPAAPALARKLRQCQRSFAIDHGLNVMEWLVARSAGVDAPRVLEPMLGRVPTSDRHIEAASKSDGIVHHHDLLMMRCAGRQIVIPTIADAPR
jgi:hypothetical protein